MNNEQFDIGIIGGGLAGLALSIQSANAGYKTILFEKETYPYHKVCGEYISLESWNFLERLGLSLHSMQLPIIKTLNVSAPNGKLFETSLGDLVSVVIHWIMNYPKLQNRLVLLCWRIQK
jgi:2-polyprenyl-6-methoxyphenol hydroxylase-like FAD-dependent oxidoreductase